ncbi:aspartyl/glutamyl-tRNA(Asn/Gln) amidotransferase, B subunit [Marvinbryantia formatexigens DSM 14469]|uniref:Aspartyl/glutamyl-tRNA(Asn/Gln) amidotransferase subunit B n=1 Tax=Marvinbryantia formatexigens DSM 14469 TaxID=478749 RepID=C6LM40_9FIRM|nr:Asp-tRNA(Asn)/Glu-tRNA(Gln) amidotransferase subunit GatB [Marvinbryantia formatexigens]EET58298.1 aspartyl/glutamyl-tRNA(Asn/Gln) amidotransferase, B subunit [Marvinbryantia formatexigens DSM 14469]UWO24838.1 Asp-tRNA(Asn)/Glu-tRNA(Gln) amidotransferase subunit GatB [Marvinbryantia formatexigens DSM 14469]SDG79442.1 aspartyl/glutamyl-tRNA(Asn/Gln) amidotransferase subunit B [Marvinbryantia formatexigens]
MAKQYETVIGLEVHVELATKTKIFCGCSTQFGGAPNTHTCPVCTGMPGSLPVLNKQVVEYALAVGLATNCQINQHCKFDRKNYFYPDNPQNYQISQLYLPICHDGGVEIETEKGKKTIGIHEIHMEEDAGKLIHDEWEDCSLVDFNRSGVPLIEIVSEPDMRSAEEVIAYLDKLRLIIQYLGASDCKLQEGSMRADVNLSVREAGAEKFGTRTEMKNLNSFKAIAHAIENERERQIDLLEAGEAVVQETRRWDDTKEYSYAMRSKEDAQDYRYFPDPDLTPVYISDEWIARVRAAQPELRTEKLQRYKEEFSIPEYDAGILTSSKRLADLFEEATAICKKPKKVSNWLMGETLRLLKENGQEPEDLRFSPENLAKLVNLADAGTVNNRVAKEVFEKIFTDDIDPEVYVEEHGLKTVNDEGALRSTVEAVIAANPQSVADYKGGKEKAIGFLVGQTMKAMKGKADPGAVNKMLKEILSR